MVLGAIEHLVELLSRQTSYSPAGQFLAVDLGDGVGESETRCGLGPAIQSINCAPAN
jgi:hypothetical protein